MYFLVRFAIAIFVVLRVLQSRSTIFCYKNRASKTLNWQHGQFAVWFDEIIRVSHVHVVFVQAARPSLRISAIQIARLNANRVLDTRSRLTILSADYPPMRETFHAITTNGRTDERTNGYRGRFTRHNWLISHLERSYAKVIRIIDFFSSRSRISPDVSTMMSGSAYSHTLRVLHITWTRRIFHGATPTDSRTPTPPPSSSSLSSSLFSLSLYLSPPRSSSSTKVEVRSGETRYSRS